MFVDWVQCTLSDPSGAVKEWIQSCLRGPWIGIDHAPYQYTHTLKCGGVSILTDKPGSDNIRLVISGGGCRELEGAGAVSSWPAFLARLLSVNAKFSRLDAAIDDHDGVLSMDTILLCCKEGRVVSRYNKIMPLEEMCSTTGLVKGREVQFGERSSKTLIRIYDKALKEQVAGHWIRVELETHDEKAQALAQALTQTVAEGKEDVVPATLLGCVDFKVRGSAERRERWTTEAWWTRFLGTTERFHLETAPRNESLEKSYYWLLRIVSRVFAMVYYSGSYPALIEDMLEQGRQKWDAKLAKDARKQQKPKVSTA